MSSDEEPDYMSDDFLAKCLPQDVKPGLKRVRLLFHVKKIEISTYIHLNWSCLWLIAHSSEAFFRMLFHYAPLALFYNRFLQKVLTL